MNVFGLPCDLGDAKILNPLGVVLCLKYLEEDGEVAYKTAATNDISTVEAQGMALLLLDELRDSLRNE